MSSFYAPSSGVALLLNTKETNDLVTNIAHCLKNEGKIKDIQTYVENAFENFAGGDVTFPFSTPILEDEITFFISEVDTDIHDGMYFSPLVRKDGTPNIGNDIEYNSHGHETCYVIFTDKSTTPAAFLNSQSYNNTNEIVAEFIRKIGKYVPSSFEWYKRIGYFEYVTCG